jgi:prepilin-type N-terminal cleavage/methylation domain-containing protein
MHFSNDSRGFTLIELLVVIAIIGILASIILASLSAARVKGMDAARIADIKSLESAMELYYDSNGHYPQSCAGVADSGLTMVALATCLVPTDIGSMPAILISDGDQYVWSNGIYGYGLYVYTSSGVRCRTGINVNPGWWGSPATCAF